MRKMLLSSVSAVALAFALPVVAQDSGSSGSGTDSGTQSSQAGQEGQTSGSSTGQPMTDEGSTSTAGSEQPQGGDATSTGTAQSEQGEQGEQAEQPMTGTAESGQSEQPATGTAQTDQPATGSDTAATSDDSAAGADEMGGFMRGYAAEAEAFQGTIAGGYAADDLIGKTVVGPDGDEIAEVEDLLIGPDDKVQHVLVDVGGFLGIGGKTVALSIEDLQVAQGSGEELVTNMTEDEISALPALEEQDGRWVMAEQPAE